jgi:hypothetical protein
MKTRKYLISVFMLSLIVIPPIYYGLSPKVYKLNNLSQAVSACIANPGTINIDGLYPEPDIQTAINNAQNGDTVCVGPGTYYVNLSVYGKYIDLESSGGASQTTLSSASGGPVLVWQDVPFTGYYQAYLIGFTITGGSSNSNTNGQAGGLTLANGADVQVRNSNITGNSSTNYGGGIIVYQSSPVFANDEISHNSSSQGGGGALVVSNSNPCFFQTNFDYNSAGSGGAVWADSNSAPVFVEDEFGNNFALSAGGAIGERIGVAGVIEDNSFNNDSAPYGGAIDLETSGNGPQIIGNVFYNDSALTSSSDPSSGFGGAISAYNSSSSLVEDNSFQNDQATQGGGAIVVSENANLTIVNNTFYADVMSQPGQGEGGGLYVSYGSASVSDNCFVSDKAGAGGAVVGELNSTINLSNNTLINDVATLNANGYPGGIRLRQGASSLTSSYDLIANSTGSDIEIDGSPVGSYSNDDITSATAGADLVQIGSTSYTNVSSLPSSNFKSIINVQPQFVSTPGPQVGSCVASNTSALNGAGVQPQYPSNLLPVYRFFSAQNHTHFFTQSQSERDSVLDIQPVAGFNYEAIAWWAYTSPTSVTINGTQYSTVPVARYREVANPGIHFFTISPTEEATLSPNDWIEETPSAFYVFPPYTPGMQNVCRFNLIGTSDHFWTANPVECYMMQNNPSISQYWYFEGMAFSVPPGVTS